jgi:hypothetical protein
VRKHLRFTNKHVRARSMQYTCREGSGCTCIQHTCIQHMAAHSSNIHASNIHASNMHPTYMHPTHGCTCIQHTCIQHMAAHASNTDVVRVVVALSQDRIPPLRTCQRADAGEHVHSGRRPRQKRRKEETREEETKWAQEMWDKCRCASLSHALLVTSVDTRGLHSRPAFQGKGACRSSGGCRGSANVATAPP